MTNQRRILGILRYEFVTNVEVATLSQLPSINEAISRSRHSLFGCIRRMDQAALAHQALHLSVMSRQGSGQYGTWRRQPGRPRKCWVEQVTTSTGLSPSDSIFNSRCVRQNQRCVRARAVNFISESLCRSVTPVRSSSSVTLFPVNYARSERLRQTKA